MFVAARKLRYNARHAGIALTIRQLTEILELQDPSSVSGWIARLVRWEVVKQVGVTKGTRYFVDPTLLDRLERKERTLTRSMTIDYRADAVISVEAAIDLYNRSTLGERRPVDRPDVFAEMLRHADILITAWDGDRLVGISRTLTDFSYAAYLADLAVDADYQRLGIGKRLVEETRARLWPECMIVLLAAPLANDYYPRIGFEHNPRAWVLRGDPTPRRPD